MNASEQSRAEWLDTKVWERLDFLEARHQRVQTRHEALRRGLERIRGDESSELRQAWDRYCEVIGELDRATADIETLRTRTA
jgi:hypothetical protein